MHGVDARAKMRKHRLEIGDERHVGPRARDVGQIDASPRARVLPERRPAANVALRARRRTTPPGRLSAFAAHEVRERDIHAMLVGDVADQPIPAADARRAGDVVWLWATARAPAARRRRK